MTFVVQPTNSFAQVVVWMLRSTDASRRRRDHVSPAGDLVFDRVGAPERPVTETGGSRPVERFVALGVGPLCGVGRRGNYRVFA
jgi:hypothetical protein